MGTFTLLFHFGVGLTLVFAECGNPTAIVGATYTLAGSPPFTEGTKATYKCDAGYTEGGISNKYTCTNGNWVGNYKCNKIYCPYVKPPKNGRVTNNPNNEVYTSISFACDDGYDMGGKGSMLCRVDGKWNPNRAPTCNPKICEEFGNIAHGETIQIYFDDVRNSYKSIVRVTCLEDYILNGSPTVMCEADGMWGKKPTCKPVSCPAYPGLNSSCIDGTDINDAGTLLFIFCKEGDDVSVTQTGGDSTNCIDNKWVDSEGAVACFCDCKVEADLDLVSPKNLNAKGFLKHGHQLKWSCKNGATKATGEALVCNDGKMGTPICTPKPTENPPISTDSTVLPVPGVDCRVTVSGGNVVLLNVDGKGYLKNGMLLDWKCDGFFKRKTSEHLLRCNKGNIVDFGVSVQTPSCSNDKDKIVGLAVGISAAILIIILVIVVILQKNKIKDLWNQKILKKPKNQPHSPNGKSDANKVDEMPKNAEVEKPLLQPTRSNENNTMELQEKAP